jgi:hypothetical protein
MKPRYGTCPTSSSAELRAALAQYTARDRDQVRLDPDEAVRQTLMRLESAQMFLEGAPWRDFFPAGPAGRLTILKQCLEHVLADRRAASENGIGLNGWPDVMSALLDSGLPHVR